MYAHHLSLCLKLAEAGRGYVKTNPLVGCVIVAEPEQGRRLNDDHQIVAEGFHKIFGGIHAEMMALDQLFQKNKTINTPPLLHEPQRGVRRGLGGGKNNKHLTLYVSLEPCCTRGKQPPCTAAIIASGIKRVVFGARDPSNAGAEILRKAGIEVIGPVMEAECRRQNKGFFSVIEQGRPYVTIKKAMRKDGSIKGKITNEEQDRWCHTHLRATHDAILVGAGTVIADDPQLTVRFSPLSPTADLQKSFSGTPTTLNPMGEGGWGGEGFSQPIRIILDPHSELPSSARVLTDEYRNRTIIIHEKLPIPELLDRLLAEGITSVLVEGGPTVWQSFEESGCVDEVVIMTNEKKKESLRHTVLPFTSYESPSDFS